MAGKIISVSSVKGGVGKTTTVLNLAGIYSLMEKRVLIIDMDLYSGGIAVSLDIKNKKDIFMMVDSMANNRFTTLKDYVTIYNKYIDVLACPRDPREAMKIESRFIPMIFDAAKKEYDVILVDMNHVLDEINLTVMDYSYMTFEHFTKKYTLIEGNDTLLIINDTTLAFCFDKKGYYCIFNYGNTGKSKITR